ncbi:HsdM family class I SAM-dependent methyltransferase [Crocosphaera sp. XPORK-15E]|uniref:HsdM family class I SAM-dependent methyltransferase n=1 Tax=Crocosphaera sp. XPORK-15E TaxID=3110247 RepID=UPI002B212D05|nr:N-6 DNA methylase [Crocosphaera sp. XPORK-15E]MEA5535268.1 N-6 DNA methylase [Crocosphaera sp. XPORK-15E]
MRFQSQDEKHELSHLYEAKIKNMGNAGRNGGEYYTPRPLIRAMIQVIKPQLGERIYDGACGSAGFLCESYEYLRKQKLTTKQLETLQKGTLYGKEKKSLAYVIGIMNMILHGIDAPNIIHTNTLTENINDIQPNDRFDIILANPPFGGSERKEIKETFPIKTGETAFLFLQHFIKMLKPGGRAAIVIKNTFLSNADNASKALREELLTSCNLHTILDCPGGTFIGAGVKTVVLFFEKRGLRLRSDHALDNTLDNTLDNALDNTLDNALEGGLSEVENHNGNGQLSLFPMVTERVWYYQLDIGRSLGKTNPLNDDDLGEFVAFQGTFKESDKSWFVEVTDIDRETFDLSVKNPNAPEEDPLREPWEILEEISALDAESAEILASISGML